MKRIVLLLLSAALLLALCACGREAEAPAAEETALPETTAAAAPVPPLSPAEAYRAVLTGETNFIDAYSGAPLQMTGGTFTDNDGRTTSAYRYVLVDLDGDRTEELAMHLREGRNRNAGFLVLRHQGDWVYGYSLPWDSFHELKEDGTMNVFLDSCDGVGGMTFTDTGWDYNLTVKREATRDADGNVNGLTCTVNGETVTEEAFRAARIAQEEKADARWYYLSLSNYDRLPQAGNLVDILSGDGVFYSRSCKAYMTLADEAALLSALNGVPAEAAQFSLDMDGDGETDAVVRFSDGSSLVLHEQDGVIQAIDFDYTMFKDLKADGTFSWGGRDQYYGSDHLRGTAKMNFDPDIWGVTEIHRKELNPDAGGHRYSVNMYPASQQAFEKALTNQAAKEDAAWLDYPAADYSELFN